MRIGIDYTSAVCQGAGIGRYTRELVRSLLAPDQHNEYRLFAAARGSQTAQQAPVTLPWHTPSNPSSRVRGRLLPLSDQRLSSLWHRFRLPLPVELLTGPIDIFHAPDFTLPPVWRARTLLTIHDLSFLTHPDTSDPLVGRYLRRVVPPSVARADHLLAVSDQTRRDLMQWLAVPEQRVSVVYSGVDPGFERILDPEQLAAVRARYHLPPRFLLHVGTLQPRKNLVRLIEAYALLHQDWPADQPEPPALVLAGGKGWLYNEIFEAVRRLGLESLVHFPGFVTDADLPALYTLADLFVFPTLYEGFGLPVLEAMACGTPVVCSNTSSLPEIAGDAALLVTPTDTGALAAAMHQFLALRPDLRARLIAQGQAQAQRFTWEETARQTAALYQKLSTP
jgi:glycosyltransferase involved in cell wall biosynthesis